MTLFDIVNIIGSTIYFVVALLLAWLSHIPRTNPGAGWWAAAIFCGFIARVSLIILLQLNEPRTAESIYAIFIMLEKLLLLIGACKFFNYLHFVRFCLVGFGIASAWIATSWAMNFNTLIFSISLAFFNSSALFFLGFIIYRERHSLPNHLLLFAASICFVFGLYWQTYPLVHIFSGWAAPGFLIGTSLALLEYLSLMFAVLLQFQKRLIDAESNALELAYHDPLTGLNNKRYMNTLFDQALILAMRPHQMLALIYIDLDNFKPINDSAGHLVGDEVLKVIAKRLVEHTRSTDICARIGGDEFVVIATQLDSAEHASQIAEKILAQCCKTITVDHHDYQLGASIGVSLYPAHSIDLPQLLKNADEAMYAVKKNGKSGYQIFNMR